MAYHKFRINAVDMDGFCVTATREIPEFDLRVVPGYDEFCVLFSGTKDEAKKLKSLIEERVCPIEKTFYARGVS
jgi:hypothetical protein